MAYALRCLICAACCATSGCCHNQDLECTCADLCAWTCVAATGCVGVAACAGFVMGVAACALAKWGMVAAATCVTNLTMSLNLGHY
jgi:hypothetical protein